LALFVEELVENLLSTRFFGGLVNPVITADGSEDVLVGNG